jgi:hypothetical protein
MYSGSKKKHGYVVATVVVSLSGPEYLYFEFCQGVESRVGEKRH